MTETGEQELHDLGTGTADESVGAGGAGGSEGSAWLRRPSVARWARRGRPAPSGLLGRLERIDTKHAVILALVISVVALTLAMPLRTYFSQRSEFHQLTTSNEHLQRQVADYQRKVNEQNDPAYIEAKARQRLHFLKPGERAVVMMFPGDDQRRAAQQAQEQHKRNPWYGNLWEAVATPPTATTPPAR